MKRFCLFIALVLLARVQRLSLAVYDKTAHVTAKLEAALEEEKAKAKQKGLGQ